MFSPFLIPMLLGSVHLMSKTEANEKSPKLRVLTNCLLEEEEVTADRLIDPHSRPAVYRQLTEQQWNLQHPKVFPVAYFLPKGTEEVQSLVRCGTKARIHIATNSGAHGQESIGYGSNSSVILDLRKMRKIDIEEGTWSTAARIQPGALLGQVHAYLWRHGGFGVQCGVCPAVGIGGHAPGGGMNPYSDLLGLTLDSLLELEMVDAEGRAVRASRKENRELFWALRGVGPGYIGIVTQLKIKVFPARALRVTLVLGQWSLGAFGRLFLAYQEWRAYTDRHMRHVHTEISFTSDTYYLPGAPTAPGIQLLAVHVWDPVLQPEGNATFLNKVRKYFPNGRLTVEYLTHLELNYANMFARMTFPEQPQGPPPATPKEKELQILKYFSSFRKGYDIEAYYKNRGFFVKKTFNEAQLGELVRLTKSMPNYVVITFVGVGGAVQDVPAAATAYVHRSSSYYFVIQYEGPAERRAVGVGMSWLNRFWKAAQFMDGGETYQNVPDLDDKDFLRRAYGDNLGRILKVKREWDPKNYFRSPVSLPVVVETAN